MVFVMIPFLQGNLVGRFNVLKYLPQSFRNLIVNSFASLLDHKHKMVVQRENGMIVRFQFYQYNPRLMFITDCILPLLFCFLNISIELFDFWIQIIPPIYRFTAVCRNVKSVPANSLY